MGSLKLKTSWKEATIDIKADLIESRLREYKDEIRLKDLQELLNDEFELTHYNLTESMKIKPTIQKVRFGFYQYVPQKSESNIDDLVLEVKKEDKNLVNSVLSFSKPVAPSRSTKKYRFNDDFVGTVTGIETYGVFLEKDGISGLVHVTNMLRNKQYITPERYFKIGDIVAARVVSIRDENKLSLSTTHLELPDYQKDDSPLSQKFGPAVEKQNQDSSNDVKTNTAGDTSKEMRELIMHIQTIVGPVSPAAQEKIKNLVSSKGLIKFMVSMVETQKDFKVDMGLKFLEEVEVKMGNHL